MFVQAQIQGRQARGVVLIPSRALHSDGAEDRVRVVDDEDRFWTRPVQVLRAEREQVLITAGLEPGERVNISPLEAMTEGMRVTVVE
jgi:multidrug efflux pump subunit AcrA (membrane-fusion protein)